jgi:hypothetical protein
MKTKMNFDTYAVVDLSPEDIESINGGGFWGRLGEVIGITAKCLYMFGQAGGEYQASLPANLKK